MTEFQRKKIKEEIERQNAKADAKADGFLEKLKASKWTGLILAGGVLLIIFLLLK